jgi:hypothetical protein
MAYTSWTKQKVRAQDFSPHPRPQEAAKAGYRIQIAEKERFGHGAEGDGGIQHWKYRKPIGGNRHLVQHPKDPSRTIELPATASNAAFVADSYVAVATDRTGSVIIGTPAPGNKGTSGFAVDSSEQEVIDPGITSIEPAVIPSGGTIDITVTGFGFRSGNVFDAVIYDIDLLADVVDTRLTFNSQTFIDSTTFEINVTSDPSAPIGYQYDLRVR